LKPKPADMDTHTDFPIGAEFLGYRTEQVVGRGGMGVVYRAYDLRLKRAVALKFIAPDLAVDEGFRERFLRESELAASLEHPNVIPIHDAGEVDGRLYLAMRYVDRTDLRTLLRQDGPLLSGRAMAICRQIGDAVDAAHEHGLVHGDLKPSNVLLDQHEHVYLADFGLTQRLNEGGGQPADQHAVGTPAYLAPEQVEGSSVDGRADVYALGCLLYECLTGEQPFPRPSLLAVVWAHLEEEPPRTTTRNAELPPAIDDVIQKAMAKEPDDRYPTCAALIAAAEQALGLRQAPRLGRRRLVLIAIACAVAVIAAALAIGLTLRNGGDAASRPLLAGRNTVVRIDPRTNAVTSTTQVDDRPLAVAVGGRRVWVYSNGSGTVSEIDATTNKRTNTTGLRATPTDVDSLGGPVLAADPTGAWMVGVDSRGSGAVTHIFPRSSGKRPRRYRLAGEPKAIAIRSGAVWVLVWGRHDAVLRLDPDSGHWAPKVSLPTSSLAAGLAVGAGALWVVAPSSAALYRIDPRSLQLTGVRRLPRYATTPEVAFGSIWIGIAKGEGLTYLVDPRTLATSSFTSVRPEDGRRTAGFGSTWWVDFPTSTVVRFDPDTLLPIATIPLTDRPSAFYGPDATAIAAGAGAIWVTIAPGQPAYPLR
jgi:serine/threonine-protein kinase